MTAGRFVDAPAVPAATEPDYWDPIVFRKTDIEAEAERLAALPAPPDGRRESLFVHPRADAASPTLAPGIRVTLSVLLPGERTRPIRHTSTQVGFCVRGAGHVVIGGTRIEFGQYDVWNHPAWRTYWFENTGHEPHVRLTYSNAPLLERLNVHLVEDNPSETSAVPEPGAVDGDDDGAASPFGTVAIDGGALLMPYETLINPPAVQSDALHWPWSHVQQRLGELEALGDTYRGRRLYLLYNPATGRTNGTTPSFFATITVRPPGIVDRPHRHVSAAINYFFSGSGWSRIGGRRYEWSAGDLMLTAPGWMVHHHASDDAERVYELTVQDQPAHIAMESLLWQENLKRPPRVLGSEAGFATNRAATR